MFTYIELSWLFSSFPSLVPRPDSSQGSGGKDKVKGESASLKTSLHSPEEGLSVVDDLDPAHLPDDSGDDLSNIDDSPGSEPSSIIGDGAEFTKMSVYSPSQERFSIPEDIGTEAQTSSSLSTSAVSDVQGAKHYLGESEFPPPTTTSTTSEASTNFFSPSTTRAYSFSQPSIAHSPLMSPSTYPAAFNPQAFPTGSTDGVMTAGAMYPNGACVSPSAYMSPYGTAGKQYTWPATPNAYGTFGMNSHDLMQSGYATTTYQPASYSQMARSSYPATYFPSPVPSSTAHTS